MKMLAFYSFGRSRPWSKFREKYGNILYSLKQEEITQEVFDVELQSLLESFHVSPSWYSFLPSMIQLKDERNDACREDLETPKSQVKFILSLNPNQFELDERQKRDMSDLLAVLHGMKDNFGRMK